MTIPFNSNKEKLTIYCDARQIKFQQTDKIQHVKGYCITIIFTIRYTFKYREAYDTITIRMYNSVTKKTISEKSFNCAPFTQ